MMSGLPRINSGLHRFYVDYLGIQVLFRYYSAVQADYFVLHKIHRIPSDYKWINVETDKIAWDWNYITVNDMWITLNFKSITVDKTRLHWIDQITMDYKCITPD